MSVEAPNIEDIAARVGLEAISAAALLLTDEPVCVVGGEALPWLERLRFLDTVFSLLPYGMRTRLSASTWTSSTAGRWWTSKARNECRLSFTKHAPEGVHSVRWGALTEVSSSRHDAHRYQNLLVDRCGQPTALIEWLAAGTEPMSFSPDGRARALARLSEFTARDDAATRAISADQFTMERLLNECADFLKSRQDGKLAEHLDRLGNMVSRQGGRFFTGEQRRYQEVIAERQLLWTWQDVDDDLLFQLHAVILKVGYGPKLSARNMDEILDGVGSPGRSLLLAMLRMPSDAVVRLTLACRLDDKAELRRAFDQHSAGDLVNVAAREPYDGRLIQEIVDELARRGSAEEGLDIAGALREHNYLSDAIKALHPASIENRTRVLRRLLVAAYGQNLEPMEFAEIVGLPPGGEPLLAAAILSHGAGAGETLLQTVVLSYLGNAGLDPTTFMKVKSALLEPKLGGPAPSDDPEAYEDGSGNLNAPEGAVSRILRKLRNPMSRGRSVRVSSRHGHLEEAAGLRRQDGSGGKDWLPYVLLAILGVAVVLFFVLGYELLKSL
ncbi:hypothetical protein N5079_14660 [Planotetraspora sp. A-T 1434]|uniref:hypothetical protein n=1 Tax=Planotetraspora sp. A-T 1434 TaxID=2979219 RepID=UPI0021BF0C2A|nr:hypothetical protein [Planotetraspora sp. A-T 1434]MCT9931459.1 hypothetical protein [Planotetraspora sp. A-T 1434]